MEDTPNLGGRPTDYKEEYNEQVYKLCLLGATDKKIADFFNVCEKTVNTWKEKHPKFLQSLKKGKDIADSVIAESLYGRAKGYTHKEVKLASHEGVFSDEKIVDKHYPPDTTACIFWLKNRQKEHWRDKHEVDHKINEITLKKEDENL